MLRTALRRRGIEPRGTDVWKSSPVTNPPLLNATHNILEKSSEVLGARLLGWVTHQGFSKETGLPY